MATRAKVTKWPNKDGKDDHGKDGGGGGPQLSDGEHHTVGSIAGEQADFRGHDMATREKWADLADRHHSGTLTPADHHTLAVAIHADANHQRDTQVRTRQHALADKFHAHAQAHGATGGKPLPWKNHMGKRLSIDNNRVFTKRDCEFFKVDDEHGIAFGYAIVSTVGGEPYFDTQGDHIPMAAVYKAAEKFMKESRAGDEQHDERRAGDVVFAMPVDTQLAKSLFGVDVNMEGLVIGFKPYDKALLGKIKRGERRGFSIGGTLLRHTSKSLAKFAPRGRIAFAKGIEFDQHVERRIFEDFVIDFISSVDWPAQEPALVTIVKSADGDDATEEPVLWMRKAVMPPKSGQKPGAFGAQPGMPGSMQPGAGPATPPKPMTPPQPMVGPNQNPMGNMGMSPPTNALNPNAMNGGGMPVEQPKLTGEADGHQHAMSMTEVGEDGIGYTGFGISTAGISHRHAFVAHPDGSVEIAVNDGHTHSADGTPEGMEVDPETGELVESEGFDEGADQSEDALDGGADEAAEGEPDDAGSFGAGDQSPVDDSTDAPDDNAPPARGARPFAPRKRAYNAGQNGTTGLASVTKEIAMDPTQQIATLKKQLADATAFGKLSDAEKAHHATLDKQDGAAFLAKSATDRKADIAKADGDNPVVYTCDDGTKIRKSDGQIAERTARKADELSNLLAKQSEKTEQLEFEKRAVSVMKHYPKSIRAKAMIVKAIERTTETVKDGKLVVDAELRKEMMDIVSAGDKALAKAYARIGKRVEASSEDEGGDNTDPEAELDKLAKAHAKEHKISFHKAYDEVLKTDEGEALYAEISGGSSGAVDSGEVDDYDDDDGGDVEVVEGTP